MEMKTLQKRRKLTDSEQTIADIRTFRWEESKKIKTFDDLQRYEKEVEEEMKKLGVKFRKAST